MFTPHITAKQNSWPRRVTWIRSGAIELYVRAELTEDFEAMALHEKESVSGLRKISSKDGRYDRLRTDERLYSTVPQVSNGWRFLSVKTYQVGLCGQ